MSYILDALKKSEKERRRGTVPDILTVQDPLSGKSGRHHLLLYPVIAVFLLIAGGLFIWWSGAGKTGKTSSEPRVIVAQKEIETGKGTHVTNEAVMEKPDIRAGVNASDRNRAQEHQNDAGKPSDAGRKIRSVELPKPQARNNPAPAVVSVPEKISPDAIPQTPLKDEAETVQKTSDIDEIPEKSRLYTLNDLPVSIRQKLPAFNITLAMYSDDPASRMVRINGQTIREGQNLSPEIKLEKIAQNGVILNYRDFRFQVETK